ncbi:hypothetical protein [Erwinia psidii]|nr:hypothetical protein [Erwinia psidii]
MQTPEAVQQRRSRRWRATFLSLLHILCRGMRGLVAEVSYPSQTDNIPAC